MRHGENKLKDVDVLTMDIPMDGVEQKAAIAREINEDEEEVSPLEIKLVQMASDGMTDQEIANKLKRSRRTVENYFLILYRKLHTKNKVHTVAAFFRAGLVH